MIVLEKTICFSVSQSHNERMDMVHFERCCWKITTWVLHCTWVWTCRAFYITPGFGHVERSTGWIAEVRKLNVVAQKRSGRPRKSWDEVLENDRKKLGMDSADPQNRSEWRGRLRERLVKKPNPR